jgi:hypothetical protein
MEQQDYLTAPETKKNGTLNVLTILTFIGCGIGLLGSIYGYTAAEKNLAQMEQFVNGGDADKLPGFMKGMITEESLAMARLQVANKLPLLIVNLLGVGLCLAGAVQMRKQKMEGYYYWLIGELLPFVGVAIFSSFAAFKGFAMIGLIFPLLFIILYTTQRKNLVK